MSFKAATGAPSDQGIGLWFRLLYQGSCLMTDVGPSSHAEGGDGVGHSQSFIHASQAALMMAS